MLTDIHLPKYKELLQNRDIAEPYIEQVFQICQRDGYINWLLKELARESGEGIDPYPAMGLVFTGYEGDRSTPPETAMLDDQLKNRTILASIYYSLLNNHPDRIDALFEQSEKPFAPPEYFHHPFFAEAREKGRAINIADIKLEVQGSDAPRQSRTELHQRGPFVSYGKQARGIIAVGANPYITGTPFGLAKLVESHSLACVPRDGFFSQIERQRDLFIKTLEFLKSSPVWKVYARSKIERKKLMDFYTRNLVVTIEPESGKALKRARELYAAGARTFRIYSPEPGNDALGTLIKLRQLAKEEGWERIEIFVGQVVDVEQAMKLEAAGADAIYVGIGGGGRCITGVVGGLTINWPQLVWDLRGRISIPIIVEGGANDHIAESLAVGASGIGAVGRLAGTIETPGGLKFFVDEKGLFRYYGGEASDAMRAMAGRVGPFGFILNREGETNKKRLRYDATSLPTLLQVFHEMYQGIVGGMVFQNASSIEEFHRKAPRSIRAASPNDDISRNTH